LERLHRQTNTAGNLTGPTVAAGVLDDSKEGHSLFLCEAGDEGWWNHGAQTGRAGTATESSTKPCRVCGTRTLNRAQTSERPGIGGNECEACNTGGDGVGADA